VAQALALRADTLNEAATNGLSAREFEVLRQLVRGQSIKDIALSMGINPKTVSNHQSVIRQKLGADSAVQLLSIARKLGF
jgi:DNA-binding CsgD family transcriptional regulator